MSSPTGDGTVITWVLGVALALLASAISDACWGQQGGADGHVRPASFRMLDAQGNETPYTCPLEPKKDPLKRPW